MQGNAQSAAGLCGVVQLDAQNILVRFVHGLTFEGFYVPFFSDSVLCNCSWASASTSLKFTRCQYAMCSLMPPPGLFSITV